MAELTIADRVFAGTIDARLFILNLLAKYSSGETIYNSDDMRFLVALLRRHPEYAAEIESGVAAIRVVENRKRKMVELAVTTKDGRETEANWLDCINPEQMGAEV